MYSVTRSFGLRGLSGFAVAVEADVSGGLPAFSIVGLPDSAVRESADRVRAAIKNLGFKFPDRRITVNLAPADVRKTGPVYDLPLLLAPDGRRLSKRDGDQSLENLRVRYSAEEIIGKLAFACGLQATPRPVTPQELAADFDWAKVPKNDIVLPESMF